MHATGPGREAASAAVPTAWHTMPALSGNLSGALGAARPANQEHARSVASTRLFSSLRRLAVSRTVPHSPNASSGRLPVTFSRMNSARVASRLCTVRIGTGVFDPRVSESRMRARGESDCERRRHPCTSVAGNIAWSEQAASRSIVGLVQTRDPVLREGTSRYQADRARGLVPCADSRKSSTVPPRCAAWSRDNPW